MSSDHRNLHDNTNDPNDTNDPNPDSSPSGNRPTRARKKPIRPVEVTPPPESAPPGPAPDDERNAASRDLIPVPPGTEPGRRILTDEQWAAVATRHDLSGQQLEVLKHLFDDETAKGTAYLMGVEKSCVDTYTRRLYKRLGVSGRVAMVRVIMQQFMTTTDSQPGASSSPDDANPPHTQD